MSHVTSSPKRERPEAHGGASGGSGRRGRRAEGREALP
ncbi:uncharacterized protein SOCE836_082770 [Sorangium cellulosum]|uniref:Uncharacterized protein n=1 Tax=Sorangium cellulosum TaxID=56 RepID=A0A4P2R0N4_SORCE|nr:uncharacterized protein SOCE836_082770 [Sorangium cellulosum]WCQ95377.1 hypothetical protein NQZ70_08153 [Sorangium sp. Soce836]